MQLRLRRSQHIFAALVVAALASCSSDDETPAAKCGNNKVEGSEQCDGTAFKTGDNCSKATMAMKSMGTLGCNKATCTYDTSRCMGASGAGGTSGMGGAGGAMGGAGGMAGMSGGGSGGTSGSDSGADVSSDSSPAETSTPDSSSTDSSAD
jgi:cysteine-rich repeat protein